MLTEVYRNDIKVHVMGRRVAFSEGEERKREKIKEWSKPSRSRFRLVLRNTDQIWSHEMTLTYGKEFPMSGDIVKRDLDTFIQAFERRYPDLVWTWRIGFQQERGKKGLGYAPHFHFCTNGFVSRKWLARTWAKIASCKDDQMLKAGTSINRIRYTGRFIGYMLGYLGKADECVVPEGYTDVGRFWGMKRGVLEKEVIERTAGTREEVMRDLRPVKRWYKAELRQKYADGSRWRAQNGKGLMAVGGRRYLDYLPEGERKRVFGISRGEHEKVMSENVDVRGGEVKEMSGCVSGVHRNRSAYVTALLRKHPVVVKKKEDRCLSHAEIVKLALKLFGGKVVEER